MPKLSKKLRELCRQHDIEPRIIEPYDLEVQEIIPVRKVWRLVTNRGNKCLKRFYTSADSLNFSWSAINHLIKRGFTQVAPFLLTRRGKPYVDRHDQLYVMTDWLEGRESDYANRGDLEIAARTLASLHAAAQGFVPPACQEHRVRWGAWPEIFQIRRNELSFFADQVKDKLAPTRFDLVLLNNLAYYLTQIDDCLTQLAASPYAELSARESKSGGFCHHDYAHHNVMITSQATGYVLDFDYAICDLRIHDVGSLILRALKAADWDFQQVEIVLAAYQEISPLRPEEIAVLPPFFLFPQDFWRLVIDNYYGLKTHWSLAKFQRKIERVLENEPRRQVFLNKFADYIKKLPANVNWSTPRLNTDCRPKILRLAEKGDWRYVLSPGIAKPVPAAQTPSC